MLKCCFTQNCAWFKYFFFNMGYFNISLKTKVAFPVKIYQFEIFTRATPGSSLVADKLTCEQFLWDWVVKRKLAIEHGEEDDAQCPHVRGFAQIRFPAQNVRRNVSRGSALVFQQVFLVHQVLAKAEVGQSHLLRFEIEDHLLKYKKTRYFSVDTAKRENSFTHSIVHVTVFGCG